MVSLLEYVYTYVLLLAIVTEALHYMYFSYVFYVGLYAVDVPSHCVDAQLSIHIYIAKLNT